MKTLVVQYLPRGERSHTKKLLDSFLSAAKGTEVEELNLVKDLPDVFLPDNLNSYIQRNYLGKELDEHALAGLSKMDLMTRQLMEADAVVMAFPMYNFSVPAVVKAWFDSVMQKGKTWTIGKHGFEPLLPGRKALVLMASGGIYEGEYASFEHAASLAKVSLGLMGFETEVIAANGMNLLPDPEAVLQGRIQAVQAVAQAW